MNKRLNKLYYLHLLVFLSLCITMLCYLVPNVQKSGVRQPSEYLTPFSTFFNEEYLKDPSAALPFANLYYYGFDTYSEHHLFTPIYRALKVGTHISNLGYNDGRPEIFDLSKINTNSPNFYDYKTRYLSSFNNIAEIFYYFLPKNLKYISDAAQELQVARYTTNFRLLMGGFHILGYLLVFGMLLYRFGGLIAWSFGIAVLINPLNFFLSLSLIGFPASSLLLFCPILWFYSNAEVSLFSKKYLCMLICFTLINTFLLWISQPQVNLFFSWGPAVAFAFALDIIFVLQKKSLKNIGEAVLRVSILGGVSLLPLIPIYMIELYQQSEWLGISVREAWQLALSRVDGVKLNSLFIPPKYEIRNFSDWALHFLKGIYHNLKYPVTAPLLWLDKLPLPHVVAALVTIKLIYGLFLFAGFQVWLWFKQKYNPKYKNYLLCCLIFGTCYLFYFFGLHIVSPRVASHIHVIAPIFSFYQTLLLFMMLGFGIQVLRSNKI